MKRFILLTLILIMLLPLCGCNKETNYDNYISDLRYDILYGEGSKFSVKLYVGEKENPYKNDAISNPRDSVFLKFMLYGSNSDAEHNLTFTLNDNKYNYKMKLCNITNKPILETYITDFNAKSLLVLVGEGSYFEEITLNSIVDSNAMNYNTALNTFIKQVPSIIENNTINGVINLEFYVKVLVEKNKTYYYIGICDGKKIRAVLLDGLTGEILTTRDIY